MNLKQAKSFRGRKLELSSLQILFKSFKSAHVSLIYTDFFESALFQIPSKDPVASKHNINNINFR